MKFPKWNHPWLCQQLLYLPVYLLLLLPLVGVIVLESCGIEVFGIPFLIVFFAFGGCAIWYLFSHAPLLIGADLLASDIHSWQRDRLEYRSAINGTGRETAQRRILRRCRLWGRKWEGSDGRFTVFCKHGYSWTVFYSMLEKRLVLCQAEHLTLEQYRLLLGQARSRLRELPDGVVRFQDKKMKKQPRAYATLVVILADNVDDAVKSEARKLPEETREACILPCVVECPTGCYYMNGGKQSYEVGMSGRPARNMARGMARRLVFAVGLPRENREKRPPCEVEEFLDMSLWESVRWIRQIFKKDKTDEEKEQLFMLRRLTDGEVRVGEYAVYCKLRGRLAVWAFTPVEHRKKSITLRPGSAWYYQKEAFRQSILFSGEVSKRKMADAQIKEVDGMIRTALTGAGYHVENDDPN